ncbi:MAG: alkaline phosphatase family protein, partial [Candidatus Hydrogenedentes bacterium]|nr:alkaline phosphatase family protein [Candidatus Hydrogenedentota bacterium]
GFVEGTFSFDIIHWNHARSADILVGANWSDDANALGWKGTTTLAGTAGHGTSSPYDIHNTLIAAGPAFKKSAQNKVATGNVDLAPTILQLMGIPLASSMEGRVLTELFADGPQPNDVSSETREFSVESKRAGSTYRCSLSASTVSGKRYVNFTRTERIHNTQ